MASSVKEIDIRSYAKINLCLDVKGVDGRGYHEVAMVMQQISLHDDVKIRLFRKRRASDRDVILSCNRPYLPVDAGNIAFKAAMLMKERFPAMSDDTVRIDIKKRIPVAAGLAGGSGNCAAVLHGLNLLYGLGLDVAELCRTGAAAGSDVPFCIAAQAAADRTLREHYRGDPLACHCAVATGTGTELSPVRGLRSHLVLSKPPVSVSTARVYRGIDREKIRERPDIGAMTAALESGNMQDVRKNMINVLENYTLRHYPVVMYTKHRIQDLSASGSALMSGSGPTVFCLTDGAGESRRLCSEMKAVNRESFYARTTY